MKDYLTLKNKKIAHRGLFDNKSIPENSIPAFKKALAANLTIEFDVQQTKDKRLIVFHDKSLERLTNSKELIKNMNYEDIKKYSLLNTNEVIPTLEEVLKIIDGEVLLDIEIKTEDNIEEIGNALMKTLINYSGNYLIKSFNPKMIRWFKKNHPTIFRGLLITDNYKNKFYKYLFTSKWIMLYCKPDFLAVSKKIVDTSKVQKLRKKYPIFIWTIDNKQELKEYQSLADTYICNNLPYKK